MTGMGKAGRRDYVRAKAQDFLPTKVLVLLQS